MNLRPNEVVTGEVRLSYCALFTPKAPLSGGDPKFSTTILIPKTDTATMQRIQAAIEAATVEGVSKKWNGVRPPMIPTPIHDGDGARPSDGMPYGDECRGHWVFTASAGADRPPQVVDAQLNPVINQALIYSGVYANVYVSFYAYNAGGKKGIGCGLNAVQKTRDGEALGGSAKAADEVFTAAPLQAPNVAPFMGAPAPTGFQPYQPSAGLGYQPPSGYVPPAPQIDPLTGQPLVPPLGM